MIPSMITEFWWKVFIASLVTVGIAKLSGSQWGVFLIFFTAFIGWTIGLILLIVIGDRVLSSWKQWQKPPQEPVIKEEDKEAKK